MAGLSCGRAGRPARRSRAPDHAAGAPTAAALAATSAERATDRRLRRLRHPGGAQAALDGRGATRNGSTRTPTASPASSTSAPRAGRSRCSRTAGWRPAGNPGIVTEVGRTPLGHGGRAPRCSPGRGARTASDRPSVAGGPGRGAAPHPPRRCPAARPTSPATGRGSVASRQPVGPPSGSAGAGDRRPHRAAGRAQHRRRRQRCEVPPDAATARWFALAPAPGSVGPAVIAAHVDYAGVSGVFARLRDLAPGDEVQVGAPTAPRRCSARTASTATEVGLPDRRSSTATPRALSCG